MAQHRLTKQRGTNGIRGRERGADGASTSPDDGAAAARQRPREREAEPILRQRSREIQKFGEMIRMPIGLSEKVRAQSAASLNAILADTITLRDLYKKHHWQVSGHTFYQLHLLFDKHAEEQDELIDKVAERIQILGGISVAMGADVGEMTRIPRPPMGREEVPVQITRLLEAHELILKASREAAEQASDAGDEGTNDLLISDVVRTNELQVWFVAEHVVDTPLVKAAGTTESD
ncbi:MAG: starvation-inducible DNA-binding protein [Phycisphaerales bacterium]|jgi:starvation-inducible DNA-binding protein|nr:starvation-inducible DNA-binding protein [Phycisphaerales bacterium]